MRIRSVKPDFWRDRDTTGRWPAEVKLLYIGLWNVADDEGRFELDPDLLAADLDPFRVTWSDMEGVLAKISESGRLVVYEVGGRKYGFLPKFNDHQKPNNPTPSRLPAPTEALPKPFVKPEVVLPLGEEGRGEERREPGRSAPAVSVEAVLAAWNEAASSAKLRRCRGSDKVRKTIRARLRSPGWFDAFTAAVKYAAASDWTRGKNDRGWIADLDWLLRDGNAEKYADRPPDTKHRKETPEDAAVRAAWIEAEQRYEAGETGSADPGPGTGPGGEGGAQPESPPLPLPAPGEGLPTVGLALLGHRRQAGELQDAAHVEHGAEHGAVPPPRPVRLA